MEEAGGSSPSQPTTFSTPSRHTPRDPSEGVLRMYCDECSREAALIDHLDLSGAQARYRRLCPACAELERVRWAKERLEAPPARPLADKERRAA
jgi:hypothetical protein